MTEVLQRCARRVFAILLIASACSLPPQGWAGQTSRKQLPAAPGWEFSSLILDMANLSAQQSGSNIILIARLGEGERSRELNRRRLFNATMYLSMIKRSNIEVIQAEGEPVKEGLGRIEIYVNGRLFRFEDGSAGILLASTGKDLGVTEGPDSRFFPWIDE
jgi:hypothetical protein